MKDEYVIGEYFYGNKISGYGLENGYVDYLTLAKAFDAVMSNDIISITQDACLGIWELTNGDYEYYEDTDGNIYTYDEMCDRVDELEEKQENCTVDMYSEEIEYIQQPYYKEVFQYFIISGVGAEILQTWTDEIVYYNKELDMYVWGVTHYGTSWDYVLTNIRIEKERGN